MLPSATERNAKQRPLSLAGQREQLEEQTEEGLEGPQQDLVVASRHSPVDTHIGAPSVKAAESKFKSVTNMETPRISRCRLSIGNIDQPKQYIYILKIKYERNF